MSEALFGEGDGIGIRVQGCCWATGCALICGECGWTLPGCCCPGECICWGICWGYRTGNCCCCCFCFSFWRYTSLKGLLSSWTICGRIVGTMSWPAFVGIGEWWIGDGGIIGAGEWSVGIGEWCIGDGGIIGAGEWRADMGEFCINDEGLVMEGDWGVDGPIPRGVPGPDTFIPNGELTERGEVCWLGTGAICRNRISFGPLGIIIRCWSVGYLNDCSIEYWFELGPGIRFRAIAGESGWRKPLSGTRLKIGKLDISQYLVKKK